MISSARNESKAVNRETSEAAEKRKKKKSYYAKLKREEDDKMAELAAKYRDRAAERRDGGVPGAPAEGSNVGGSDQTADESDNAGGAGASNTSGYRAVAPDVKSSFDAAERRKRMIQARTVFWKMLSTYKVWFKFIKVQFYLFSAR